MSDHGGAGGAGGTLACSPEDCAQGAQSASKFRDDLAAVVTRLAGVLKGCGGMAGSDSGAEKWAHNYDPACGGRGGAEGAMEVASDIINGAGMMHDLLYYTGANHSNADNPDAPVYPPGSPPVFKVPAVPQAFGGGSGGEPGWWTFIAKYVEGAVWPNGHEDKLKEAADAYKTAADGARAAETHIPEIISRVNQQNIPEAATIVGWCNRLQSEVNTLADTFAELGKACEEYAHQIHEAHEKIKDAAIDLAWQSVLIEGGGAVLGFLSGGLGEGGAQVLEASRLAAIGKRIAEICRAFVAAAEVSGLPLVAEVGALARVSMDLRPLLTARAVLYGGFAAEDAAVAGDLADLEKIIQYRRPYLRKSTKEFIDANTEKATVDGQPFYRSATDRNVYMPQDKTWAGKTVDGKPITSLEKDSTGKYYVDAEGRKYPVDPVWHYGHEYDREWWRLQEEARSANPPWTQKQMNDYVNDHPEIFRIEDAPGNVSHAHERPRE
ncbi:hypothetical protein Srot_2804 [Segniliparus rotundus DSM 44985]|uniref:Uncharacterized protein n=1 Tax=Segniliparus rotundus (strain ATCC BAA-972 / CDC 1076 / CIP 108378 / DSM 44985 / JCM 13578) TaxID=640132 RepID=D6ZD49_SEGRD|nr:HNH/ENDO VII family nuclease [Segniliparus rotundus]ADG99236.1 hypothetical protein Srot_2804 [Segniliparus rotundus DSM 44985]